MQTLILTAMLMTTPGDGATAQYEPLDAFGNLIEVGDWSNAGLWDQLSIPDIDQVAVFGLSGLGPYQCRVDDMNPIVSGVLMVAPDATLLVFDRALTVIDDPDDINGVFSINSGTLNTLLGTVTVLQDANGGGFMQNQGTIVARRGTLLDVGELIQQGTLRVLADGGGTANVEIVGDVTNTGLIELDAITTNAVDLAITGGTLTNGLGVGTLAFRTGTGGSTIRNFTGDFVNLGTVLIEAGLDVTFDRPGASYGNASNGGGIHVGEGSTLWINGSATLDNTIAGGVAIVSLADGASILLDGATILGGRFLGNGSISPAPGITTATLDSIVLDGATLLVQGQDLAVVRGVIANDGIIRFADASIGTATMRLDGNVTIDGDGVVDFTTSHTNEIVGTTGTEVLTLAPGQHVVVPEADDLGALHTDIVNQGLVESLGTLNVTSDSFVNDGEVRSAGGGTLAFLGSFVDNTGGVITITGSGSRVHLDGATISGGVVQSDGLGVLSPPSTVTVGTIEDVHLDGVRVNIANMDEVIVRGTVVNDGRFELNDTGNGIALLTIDGSASIDGSGTIEFRSPNTNRMTPLAPGAVLTIGAGVDVVAPESDDRGEMRVDLVNHGVIESFGQIDIDTDLVVNRGQIRATDSGDLLVIDCTVDNADGVIVLSGAGSRLFLDGATIAGGTVQGEAGSGVTPGAGDTVGTLDGTSPLTLDGADLDIHQQDEVILRGTIINDATITLIDAGTGQAHLAIDGDVTIEGHGALRFTGAQVDRIIPVHPDDTLTIGPAMRIDVLAGADAEIEAHVVNHGQMEIEGLTEFNGGATLTNLPGATIAGGSTLDLGTGTLMTDGVLARGSLDVTGSVEMGPSSVLAIELEEGMNGSLVVTGDLAITGDLVVSIAPGYAPEGGEQFTIAMTGGAVSGAFDVVSGAGVYALSYEPNAVVLTLVSPPLPGDIDGDGSVSFADLLAVLAAWGPCPEPCGPDCSTDLDGDCTVGFGDVLIVLANWT